MSATLRLGTRGSKLALWQANWAKARLGELRPDISVEIQVIRTMGDQVQDRPLVELNIEGAFTKELDRALLTNDIDFAVHSLKDVPTMFPEGITLAAVPEREDPRDAFVSNNFKSLEELPQGARLGTSSLRRQSQIAALRPDLKIIDLRGNVNTRLKKLDDGEYDAIILAAAGLKRLEFEDRITQYIATAKLRLATESHQDNSFYANHTKPESSQFQEL